MWYFIGIMSATHLHSSESESQAVQTQHSDEVDEIFSHGVNRARALAVGAVGVAVIAGGAGVAHMQAEQRDVATTIAVESDQKADATKDAYQQAIEQALDQTYSQRDQLGEAFLPDANGSIFDPARAELTNAGIETASIDLGPLVASTKQLAADIPQPDEPFVNVKTDIDSDGTPDIITVPAENIIPKE
jgi:hypothetical protein